MTFGGGVFSRDMCRKRKTDWKRDAGVSATMYMKAYKRIHRLFGIPPIGRDHKATLKQSMLPLGQLQLSLHSPPVYTRDPTGHSEGWLKLEHIHLNPLPASTNGC